MQGFDLNTDGVKSAARIRWSVGGAMLACLVLLGGCLENSYRARQRGALGEDGPAARSAMRDRGSGPTKKRVRVKNGTTRKVGKYFTGFGSRNVDGSSPQATEGKVGPNSDEVGKGNSPGDVGSGFSSDKGYEEAAYKWEDGKPAKNTHPSMVVKSIKLAAGNGFAETSLADIKIVLTGAKTKWHVHDVRVELREKESTNGREMIYEARWRAKWSIYRGVDTSGKHLWNDNPTGSPSSYTSWAEVGRAVKPSP